jgi:pimeloyl-ACP methyl ester carboxylesterase
VSRPLPDVVVFVPGILGTELVHNGQTIWPGTIAEYVTGYKHMDELLSGLSVAGDIIRRFGPLEQYGALVDDLGRCGFSETAQPHPTLYLFPYDWRLDNTTSAGGLANLIDAISASRTPAPNIAIVAHSMGGLIARYYLESSHFESRPGFAAVRQLITLATPHRGAPLALAAALGQISRLFLSEAQVAKLANHPDYPSLYQLLPPKDEPFAWNNDAGEGFGPVDIYDAVEAKRLGLSEPLLQKAVDFHSGLSLRRAPSHVRYFAFYGTELQTITAMYLLPWQQGYHTQRDEADHGGDKTVPVWSAALNGIQGHPTGGEHGSIYKDRGLLRILGRLLGRPGILAAAPSGPVVLVPDHVVAPAKPMDVHVSFDAPVRNIDGHISFVLLREDGTPAASVPLGVPHAIHYDGADITTLQLRLRSPDWAGFYEAVFTADGMTGGSDRFIVQV